MNRPYDPNQRPMPQQPPAQQYPQPYPQQYAPRPQAPPGAFPQAAYGHPPAPAKKGLGAGAIIGIVLGALVLLGGGAIAVVVFLLADGSPSATASLSDTADNSAALLTKAAALQGAVRTKDPKQVEVPLLEFAMLPDKASVWFTETFGAAGASAYSEWDTDVFKSLPDLITPFRDADTKGQTELRATRLGSAAEVAACATPFCVARKTTHAKIFKAMKRPVALYVLRFAKPGSPAGDDEDEMAYFAVANGQLVFVGNLASLW